MSKKHERTDPRILRTRQFLRDALIALIREKGFDTVQVQEITDRAKLNRATFYLHYRDKNDLLVKSMRETLGQLEQDVGSPPAVDGQVTPDAILKPLISVFDHFARYSDFYYVMLCEIGVPSAINEMQHYIEQVALRWMSKLQPDPTRLMVETEMVIKFVSAAYIGVVKWWLNNDMPHSSEHMAKQFMNLVSLGVFRSVGLDLPMPPDNLQMIERSNQ
jgi:AcrR family transcriptional regulator